MQFQVKFVLACLISFIWTQQSYCANEVLSTSTIKNWTCKCLYSHQGNQNYTIESNCSTSCNCSHDARSGNMWTCLCSADGLPKLVADDHNANCFTACNCTSGSLGEAKSSKKHFSRKAAVIVLLTCVILTTLAFAASVTCYFYRKEKFPIQSQVFSSDRETSCDSASNLISLKTHTQPETKIAMNSSIVHIRGCFYGSSCLFGSKLGTVQGTMIQFSYSELQNATGKFSSSNLIGNGGSSYVYRGLLKDGRIVAVKRLKSQKGPDAESVFLTEIELLSRLHHCHVVQMVGYCSESDRKQHAERLLVYEYMPNGNLRECLDGALGKKMDWGTRVAIAIGAARGLEYLHEAAVPRILHRDIKSTNILLDENWQAKITDLGMAKHLNIDGFSSFSSSPARMQGTFGYFAPEYAIVGRASLKSDVFSFGVVLLELITGRHPIGKSSGKLEESLVIWATPRLLDKRATMELPDPRLDGNFPKEEMRILTYLAKECLQLDPDDRPTISEVVQILCAIAPERSTRRNIHVNLFEMSSYSIKNEQFIDKRDLNPSSSQAESPCDAEEVGQPASCKPSNRYPLPRDVVDYSRVNTIKETASSAEYVDKMMFLTSKDTSSHASDDETVDLTEPRLESFCIDNGY